MDLEIDSDLVLNLEEEYYTKGYKEGQEESTKQQYKEGKEYGYQTGFQRFLVVGYIQGLVEDWEAHSDNYDIKSLPGHISQLKKLIDDIPLTNGDDEVAMFETRVNKARNKLRVVATLTKETWKINKLDDLIKEIGGLLQVSENVDEMW